MKSLISLVALMFTASQILAQCKQKWVHYNHSKSDTFFVQRDLSNKEILDISGKKIRKAFLDSVISFLEANENRKKSNNAMYSDNKIFHHGYTEVILRNVTSPSLDTSAIRLYNFLLSEGFNGNEWDPDLYYFFTYTKKYGVVHKNHWDKNMNPDLYFKEILVEDTCIKNKSFFDDRRYIFRCMY